MFQKFKKYWKDKTPFERFMAALYFLMFIWLIILLVYTVFFNNVSQQKTDAINNPPPQSIINIKENETEIDNGVYHPNPDGTGTGTPQIEDSNQNTLEKMKLYVLDTGNSDCSLLMLPDGTNILFDVGDRDDNQTIVDALHSYGVEKLSAIVIGHWDSDHFGSTMAVLEEFGTDKMYAPKVPDEFVPTTKIYQNTLSYIIENKYTITSPRAKEVIAKGDGYKVFFLNSTESGYTWPQGDQNSYSLVVMIEYGKHRYLITSDALTRNEQEILANWDDDELDVDFMKIGHHCSKTSTSEAWLRATKPEYGVCTCSSYNDYGHPHEVVLNRLKNFNVKVFTSANDKTILVTDDGKDFTIMTGLPSADGSRPKE